VSAVEDRRALLEILCDAEVYVLGKFPAGV
jgi:hypothetical protein